jgi:glycosyltransferase involved in cell wall biosynthesis
LATVKYDPARFLVVIVDDGSTDRVKKENIEQAISGIPLVVLRFQENRGITHALNAGLGWIEKNCTTKYIARLDCGDTCDPQRFYIQVAAMNEQPEAGLSATWCVFEEKGGRGRYEYKTPITHKKIAREMYFRNVFIHPTVIFREQLISRIGYYPTQFDPAEDYAYFWKMIQNSQSFVINKFLVVCEINKTGISYTNRGKQLLARQKVIHYFGSDQFLKIAAILRLKLLFIIPKSLLLLLKSSRG